MIRDWEIKCIRGDGHLSSSHVLRNMALKSNWRSVFYAAANRIDELEKKVEELEQSRSDLMWEVDFVKGNIR